MSNNPQLSIIIPCYNCKSSIVNSLDSIDGENLGDVEIICVDDNSSDDTFEVIKLYINQTRKKVQLYSNPYNLGAAATRNKGIEISSAKYIVFLDSDDRFLSGSIDKMIKAIQTNKDVYIFDALINSKKGLKCFFQIKLNLVSFRQKTHLFIQRGLLGARSLKDL